MAQWLDKENILFFKKNLTTVMLALALVALVYLWIALADEKKYARDIEAQLNKSKDAQINDQAIINGQAAKLLQLSLDVNKYQAMVIYDLKYGKGGVYNNDADSPFNFKQPAPK